MPRSSRRVKFRYTEIWEGALKAAKRVEEKYGEEI
jgi:hypothetical protein